MVVLYPQLWNDYKVLSHLLLFFFIIDKPVCYLLILIYSLDICSSHNQCCYYSAEASSNSIFRYVRYGQSVEISSEHNFSAQLILVRYISWKIWLLILVFIMCKSWFNFYLYLYFWLLYWVWCHEEETSIRHNRLGQFWKC